MELTALGTSNLDGEISHDRLGDALALAKHVNGSGPAGGLHILVLCDRDWTHPQGGGSGANILGQSSRWLAWGNRVSVIACAYPGCAPYERPHERLEMYRFGTRSTVFPRAIWRQWRKLVPDADVVLEVINGITFLTPLWLRTPHIALMNHCHCLHYVEEMGLEGQIAAFALERAPLRLLYRKTPFVAVSHSTARELVEHGIPRDHITVNYTGLDAGRYGPGARAKEPTLLYLGRLKRYKHVEELLDVLAGVPGAVLDIAGDGDQRVVIEGEIERRGLAGRVRLHGGVDERTKLELMRRAWVNLSASRCEGWGLSVVEAAACGTPTVAIGVGGLRESIEDGRTGVLVRDVHGLTRWTRRLVLDDHLRDQLGRAALARAETYSWEQMAATTLHALQREHARAHGLPAPAYEVSGNGRPAAPSEPGAETRHPAHR